MKISDLLYYVERGHFTLPAFAHGFSWSPAQVRLLFSSLYFGYPIGSIVLWSVDRDSPAPLTTETDRPCPAEFIVDGHQRIASIYGGIRGRSANFKTGWAQWPFTSLKFHLDEEIFDFADPQQSKDPYWIDLQGFFGEQNGGIGEVYCALRALPDGQRRIDEFMPRLAQLGGILDRQLAVEYMPKGANGEEAEDVHRFANRDR